MNGKRIRDWKTHYVLNKNGCWEWAGSVNGRGYGQKFINGNIQSAHRLFYKLHKGDIPKGLYICHHCDNKLCVNPDHLFAGTAKDNMLDCRAKGRTIRGQQQPSAKLTVLDIKRIRSDARYNVDIAKTYGVSPRTIGKIKNKDSWAWVE